MNEAFTIFNVVRILTAATISFFVALALEPLWVKILRTYFARGKQIERQDTPVFNALHSKKEGTPTMGGFIVWFTVAFVTLVFWFLHGTIDGFWSRVNFLIRSETYLPLAFLIVAGLVGMADDLLGIFRRRGVFAADQVRGDEEIPEGVAAVIAMVALGRGAQHLGALEARGSRRQR